MKKNLETATTWPRIRSRHYVSAVSGVKRRKTTAQIQDELFDGIFLTLNHRNQDKGYGYQKRLLRRIVEKRQAQAMHKVLDHSRLTQRVITTNIKICMKDLRDLQHCA